MFFDAEGNKMKKTIILLVFLFLIFGCTSKNENETRSVTLGIEDLIFPESQFPDSVLWDPHPPTPENPAICGITGNPYVSRDTGFIHCFCDRAMGMNDTLSQGVTGVLFEVLFHDGEIGIYALEYVSPEYAQLGYQHLISNYNDPRYRFLLSQNFSLWLWCDAESDTVYLKAILMYYSNLLNGQ